MKQIKLYVLVALVAAFLPCITTSAEVLSGACGINAKYTLDTSTGVLRIEGSGEISNYGDPNFESINLAPWYKYSRVIKQLEIVNTITSIGSYAFKGCSSLISVNIPNSVTTIETHAFAYCFGLTSITMGDSVTTIGQQAFQSCYSLTSINIPNSVTYIGFYAFNGCTNLPVESNLRYADKYLVGAVDKTLDTYEIREDTRIVGKYAFKDCSNLTSITIPNSVTSIDDGAFWGCSGLTSITIPNSVTYIDGSAFWGCSGLTSVDIPNSVTSIGYDAFRDCTGLKSVTIGNSVTDVSGYAFCNCSNLRDIYSLNTTPPTCGSDVFKNVKTANCRLHVPAGTRDDYAFADGWCDFYNIIEDAADAARVTTVELDEPFANAEYFTLKGTKVKAPTKPGVYVVKKDGSTRVIVL